MPEPRKAGARGVIRDPKTEEIIRGLDTRCCRMSGYAHWYNLDLPEAIAVRKRLMPEDGTVSQIAMSAMEDWGRPWRNGMLRRWSSSRD